MIVFIFLCVYGYCVVNYTVMIDLFPAIIIRYKQITQITRCRRDCAEEFWNDQYSISSSRQDLKLISP